MNVIKNYLHIGVDEPFCVLHASDTHLTLCDDRNDERKRELALSRSQSFPRCEYDLEFLKNKAIAENRTLIHTGDITDFVSELNIDRVKAFCDKVDCFMSAGNHEFSLYVGEAKEDNAYRNQSLEKVQAAFTNNIRMSSRIICGVNFVAIDNSYYLIDEEQFFFLKKEIEKGLPVILAVHIPLYSEQFYAFCRKDVKSPGNLLAVPEELMRDYSAHRYEQQKADALTREVYEYIMSCDSIKVILTGHIHENFEAAISENIYQIATGVSTVREIYVD